MSAIADAVAGSYLFADLDAFERGQIEALLQPFELAPREVITTTGTPRSMVPLVPPELSYSSTWSRTHFALLGSYSPCSGI